MPQFAILGTSPYTTFISSAGSGQSRHGNIAINRWRNDSTRDEHGQWCYVKDVRSGRVWSVAHQPIGAEPSQYSTEMGQDRVKFVRRDAAFDTVTEIVVVPGSCAEVRRVTVTNLSDDEAVIELTSYQEAVLATQISDRGHRAFGNLFVQTEWLPEHSAVLAMRRPRSAKDKPLWCGHVISLTEPDSIVSCETDRAQFIGRGRSSRNPVAMDNPGTLTGTVGAVLDPVMALRTEVRIPAQESRSVAFTTFFAEDRNQAFEIAARFHDAAETDRALSVSEMPPAPELDRLGLTDEDSVLYQELATALLFGGRPAGPVPEDGESIGPGRAELLAMGITGDWPILLATRKSPGGIPGIADMLRLHRYLRARNIICDLVILCGRVGDTPGVGELTISEITEAGEAELLDEPGGIHVRQRDKLSDADIALLRSIAPVKSEVS